MTVQGHHVNIGVVSAENSSVSLVITLVPFTEGMKEQTKRDNITFKNATNGE